MSAFSDGFLLGGSLIIAIGAQNAFILRQGLRREHVFILCLTCALADALLIAVGVAGLGSLIRLYPLALNWITGLGATFLMFYGAQAFIRAINPGTLKQSGQGALSLRSAMVTCLALTFLNPHVYLDTVVLLGGLSAQYHGFLRLSYGIGAAVSSFVWFFSLGYGARILGPLFAKPLAWRVLDTGIGIIMWALALKLLWPLF